MIFTFIYSLFVGKINNNLSNHTHSQLHDTNGDAAITIGVDTSGKYLRPIDASSNNVYLGSSANPWYKTNTKNLSVTNEATIKSLEVSGSAAGDFTVSGCRPLFPKTYSNTVSSATNCYVASDGKLSRTTTTSSKTIKHDIDDLKDELVADKLYDIDVHQFKYNEGIITDKNDCRYNKNLPGFIIEELDEAYPIAIDKPSDNVKEWSWNAQYLIPPMLKLIQDQHREIEELKSAVAELKEKKN